MKAKSYWIVKSGEIKQIWATFTINEELFELGRKDEMYGRLQNKLNLPKEEIEKLIEIFNKPLFIEESQVLKL